MAFHRADNVGPIQAGAEQDKSHSKFGAGTVEFSLDRVIEQVLYRDIASGICKAVDVNLKDVVVSVRRQVHVDTTQVADDGAGVIFSGESFSNDIGHGSFGPFGNHFDSVDESRSAGRQFLKLFLFGHFLPFKMLR
ncbi:MAG: hypothetical protein JXR76_09195 [Deltaproteobacteria bacterium]|nr:hypothetical protein [Deltaproteobacteria bacterium]